MSPEVNVVHDLFGTELLGVLLKADRAAWWVF
jgi:hypothetical protein